MVLRTYTDAYVWSIRNGDVAAALRGRPIRVALPTQPQGEGVAFDGARIVVVSEHRGSAVYAVPLPTAPSSTPTPTPARTPSSPPTVTVAPADDRSVRTALYLSLGVVALVILLGVTARPWIRRVFARRR
jgi:hypothetical protein